MNRGGVFLGEYWAETLGDASLETVGRGDRRLDRGEPKTDAGGEDICMALTEDGDLNGGRGVPRADGTKSSSLSYCDMFEMRGDRVLVDMSSSNFLCSFPDSEPIELRGL